MSATTPRENGPPGSILFVCGMNAIRSPMAEALARAILPRSVYVASAGVTIGDRDPFVDAVLGEAGLTLPNHQPRRLEDLEDGFFDLVVTLSPEAHAAVVERTGADATTVEFWPMPDPSLSAGSREQRMAAYRDLYARIEARLRTLGATRG